MTPLLRDFEMTPPLEGRAMNPSLLEWGGGLVMCYRLGQRGKLVLTRLNEDGQPTGPHHVLELGHLREDKESQEDPRFFVWQDRLHVSYTGVWWDGPYPHPSVCLARLDDDLRVEHSWAPDYPGRYPWEKNWTPFEHGGRLYAVYSLQPHVILDLTHTDRGRKATVAYGVGARFPGVRGFLRGGACPALYKGEYWCFYHAKTCDEAYLGYAYAFSASPPFAPLRHRREPVLVPDVPHKPNPFLVNAIFPGGAVLRDGPGGKEWWVSYGAWDRQIRIAVFDAERLGEGMEPLPESKPVAHGAFDRAGFDALGPWGTRWQVGGVEIGGPYAPHHDGRVQEFFELFPSPKRVLELGCWEGGHTALLARHCAEVVVLEGREENIARARFMLGQLGHHNVETVLQDLEEEPVTPLGQFDAVFCVGVLYHTEKPWDLLRKLAGVTVNLFLWTHVARADEGVEEPLPGLRGKWVPERREDPLGGLRERSFWPTEVSLEKMLKDTGFKFITHLDNGRDPAGLEWVTLLAKTE